MSKPAKPLITPDGEARPVEEGETLNLKRLDRPPLTDGPADPAQEIAFLREKARFFREEADRFDAEADQLQTVAAE
ncbi:MAG: hypothetical protein AAF318_14365 [Pseudomonadota bacterium]